MYWYFCLTNRDLIHASIGCAPFDIFCLHKIIPEALKCIIQQWLQNWIGDRVAVPPITCATLPGHLNHVFFIRLRDFSGIFMCKLNIIVPGKWIGQLGQGFAYLAAQMLTLIKSGNNVNFCNKSRMDPEGNYLFNAWSYFAFFWHTCSISCYCKCSIITTNHTVILLFSWTHLLMTAFSDYDYSCSPSWVALIISCFA